MPWSRTGDAPHAARSAVPALNPEQADGSQSLIISDLLLRPSVLQPGALSEVADAVMAANSRPAEAELRAARLRAEATQKNWLPTLGPSVSLTDLGSLAAQMVVEQTLFDNGRKKAERAAARADVEVAAVTLASESNERVRDALTLYLDAERADALAQVASGAMGEMEHFAWVMGERVKAGINDRSELEVVSARLSQMRSDLSTARATAASARGELSAMAVRPLDDVSGISEVYMPPEGLPPLSVMKAEAEASRAEAEAVMARSGFLPGLSLGGAISSDGVDGALRAAAPNGLGFGTGASLRAVDAAREAASARVGQAREDAAREARALRGELAGLERRYADAQGIAAQAARSYETYSAQLGAGRRSVPDVISVFETKLSTEKTAVALRYDIAQVRIRIAALQGVLLEGHKL